MGTFEVRVRLASLTAPGQIEQISLLVDSRATLTWIPRDILEGLGIVPLSRLPFSFSGGREFERDIGSALLMINGRKAAVPVAFGEPGEKAVLGTTALEGLGFVFDRVGKELVPHNLRAPSSQSAA